MEILSKNDKIVYDTAVTIGNFDGLHKGHIKLINELKKRAQEKNLKSVVYILEKSSDFTTDKITTKRQKIEILNLMGIDYVYFKNFTKDFSYMKPFNFIEDILKNRLNARLVVVGPDCKFGYRRQGDITYLKDKSNKFNYSVDVIEKIDNISSTNIRNYIQSGDIKNANNLLGRSYSLEGVVKEGLKIGRTLGFKTANLSLEQGIVLPSNGVYKTRTKYNQKMYDSITNVGNNPTVSNLNYKRIETHIFDFDKEIYGENIEVYFLGKIRDEKIFSNREELVLQIKNDIKVCDNFGKNI